MSDPIVVTVLDRALAAGPPLLLGTLGEIVAERSGVLNLGVEGMMSIGAVTGFMTAVATGSPWLGMAVAVASGAALSLLHAFAGITLRANPVVSGLALAMLGVGLSGLLGKPYIGVAAAEAKMGVVRIPWLADLPWVGRILFGKDPQFKKKTYALPRVIQETTCTPKAAEWKAVLRYLAKSDGLYWRVTGKNTENRTVMSAPVRLK